MYSFFNLGHRWRGWWSAPRPCRCTPAERAGTHRTGEENHRYVHNIQVTLVTSPKLGGTEYYISFPNYFEILQTGIILVLNDIRTLSRFYWVCADKAAYGKGCLVFRVLMKGS